MALDAQGSMAPLDIWMLWKASAECAAEDWRRCHFQTPELFKFYWVIWDLRVSLPATPLWILDIPVIVLVGNATLGNHSTSNALNATMNGSVNSLAVLSMHLVVEQQCSTWKYKRVCWRYFHPCFPCPFPEFWILSRLEPVKLEVSANASPCSENWCWF